MALFFAIGFADLYKILKNPCNSGSCASIVLINSSEFVNGFCFSWCCNVYNTDVSRLILSLKKSAKGEFSSNNKII